ncbi:G-protein coupled receptor Mth2-like [Calliphora vicina]|uniref:G-protein coupled receptor Mth2-like n=1 Tax=Calliphora vicina TaxID=7373 RepID=UPI00325B0F9E
MTIFVYCFLPEFRNCHGKCFVMYLLYLTVTYSLICYNNLYSGEFDKLPCITIGYSVYFGTIGFLTWISIISYDTFVSLTDLDYTTLFRKYFKWGIIIPSVATFVLFVIQSLKKINEEYKPGIGSGSCLVKATRWSATFYYYIPHIIVLVFCLTLYIRLIRFLVQNEREATSFAGRLKASYMKRFSLYLRLFIFMGVIWFLEVLSYFIDMFHGQNNITFIPNMLNALHGLFIFFSITFNSRIHRYFRKRCCPAQYAGRELITLSSRTST